MKHDGHVEVKSQSMTVPRVIVYYGRKKARYNTFPWLPKLKHVSQSANRCHIRIDPFQMRLFLEKLYQFHGYF